MLEGTIEGAAEGAVEGVSEGIVDSSAEGSIDGAPEGNMVMVGREEASSFGTAVPRHKTHTFLP